MSLFISVGLTFTCKDLSLKWTFVCGERCQFALTDDRL